MAKEGSGLLNASILLLTGLLSIGLFGFGSWGQKQDRAYLMFSIGAIAIVIFFGLALLLKSSLSQVSSFRTPLASSIIITYLLLVITFSNYMLHDLPDITELLLKSFTTIVGIVIAFYFGASAYVEGKNIDRTKKED